jgi:hypothetical protein
MAPLRPFQRDRDYSLMWIASGLPTIRPRSTLNGQTQGPAQTDTFILSFDGSTLGGHVAAFRAPITCNPPASNKAAAISLLTIDRLAVRRGVFRPPAGRIFLAACRTFLISLDKV